jgi:hypothetical protein
MVQSLLFNSSFGASEQEISRTLLQRGYVPTYRVIFDNQNMPHGAQMDSQVRIFIYSSIEFRTYDFWESQDSFVLCDPTS